MKPLKKLDDYLLHHYPSIWITRVHIFLPVGLIIAAVLFYGNMMIPWNPKDDFPNSEIPVVLMIIPVLIYLVYWFVFQSRYSVAKSGGRMPIGFEYLNFLIYYLVFFVAFFITCAIPLSSFHKIKIQINPDEIKTDVKHLNAGNPFMNGSGVTFLDNGMIEYYPADYVYYWGSEYYGDIHYGDTGIKTVNRNQALVLIKNYITAYNKYTYDAISKSAHQILKDLEQAYSSGSYTYDESDWTTQYKLSELYERIEEDNWYGEFGELWFWKIAMGLIAFFALLVWIFKQMKLRQFVFGFIAIVLTPLLVAIVGVILFGLIGMRGEEEETVALIVFLAYGTVGIFVFRGMMKEVLNNTGYVMTMYLQFFLPLFPFFLWLFFGDHRHLFDYDLEYLFNVLYWSTWIVGLLSILMFKPLYRKFGSLPAKS